ncbi:MAG TPA: hypothetical protein VND65_16455 [Candidatus Binatia bacterium]|nr:hypothetical protein [Candidatus Binatia bacterium]
MKMTKKFVLAAFPLLAVMLLAGNSFGQACSGTPVVHYVGIGSSAQYNTLSYGASDALANQQANVAEGVSAYLAPTNYWFSKSAQVIDARANVNTVDAGLKISVIYDSNANCNMYVVYSADSVQGDKDYFCYGKMPTHSPAYVGIQADCYGHTTGAGSWETLNCTSGVVPGLSCNPAGALPANIQSFLVTQPLPTFNGTVQKLPPFYCGQTGNTSGKAEAGTAYCYFNVSHTDVRPEDGLYATSRALSSYNTTNGLAGMGYNQSGCGAVTTGGTGSNKLIGCPIYDSFAQNTVFYALNWALSGADPYSGATVPGYTTISLGASPIVVFVNNSDTSSLGFGKGNPGPYLFTDVNHKVLSHVFDGTDSCTGDLLSTINPTNGSFGGTIPGSGEPIQVVLREPLSGTYNTFEFTGVRTLSGSAATANGQNKITTAQWISDDESSQEADLHGNLGATFGTSGPAFNFNNGTGCPGSSASAPDGSENCGDPLYNQTQSLTSFTSCGTGVKVRAIGTGESVKAGLGSINPPHWSITDGIAYAFWGYSNFAPAATGCTGTGTSGNVACGTYKGHYLTVDAIDPLCADEGCAAEQVGTVAANNFPQCGVVQGVAGYGFPCQQIPFTNIYNGKYPLWSVLRLVSFPNVAATATVNGTVTPEGVINVIGYAQQEAAPGSAEQLSDFVPFLNSISGLPYQQGGTNPTGNLNLGVFRSHFLQSAINPNNGHVGCVSSGVFSFNGVALAGGGNSTSKTCLVDKGGDMGGSVLTVRSDADFYLDFNGSTVFGYHNPSEIYDLRQ